jgi:plasmid maintenance system antidote protein VapI
MSEQSPIEAAMVNDALEAVDNGAESVNIRDGHSGFFGADELAKKLEKTDHHVEWILHNTKQLKEMDYATNIETISVMKDGGEQEGWDAYMVTKLKNVNGLRMGQKVDGCHVKFGLTTSQEDTAAYEHGYFVGIYPDKKVVRGENGKREITCGKYDLNEQFTARITRGSVTVTRNDEENAFDVIGDYEGTSMYGLIYVHEKDALGTLEKIFAVAMVTSIDINGNNLTDAGMDRLATALEMPFTKVTSIDLGLNRIRDQGATRLASVLEKSSSRITSLVLSHNEIGDEGAKKLAEAIGKEGCRVTKLWLTGNMIGDDGAMQLADMLEKETSQLSLIELAWNKIEDEGAQRLIQAISCPECKVDNFTIDHNKYIDKKTRKMLTMILSKLPRLLDMT